MPVQHIDGSAALDSGLSAARIARHLSLRFSSPNNRNRLAILILTQANPFSMTLPISSLAKPRNNCENSEYKKRIGKKSGENRKVRAEIPKIERSMSLSQ
jgi:hypothetical protein